MAAMRPAHSINSGQVKLCYILPDYDPSIGSHFFHLYELLQEASKKIDIFVVIEKAREAPHEPPFAFYVQKYSWAPLRFLELVLVLVRQRFRGFKNFYTHYSYFGAIASGFATVLLGGKSFYWNCGMPWLYKRSWFKEYLFRYAMRRNIFVTGTDSLRNEYVRRYRLKRKHTRILPNWINVKRFTAGLRRKEEARDELGIPHDKKVVLFVHHLSERKGADLLPEIASGFKERDDILFVVVGGGPIGEKVRAEVSRRQLGDIIRLEGVKPNRLIPFYFWASDIFLMPSEEEGFPRVLLEAMASGVPFVASDVGGVHDFVPEEARRFLCETKDINCFQEKIKTLLENEQRYEAFRAAELEAAKKFDLLVVLKKFLELF